MKGGKFAPWALLLWAHHVVGSTVFQAASITRHNEGDTFLLRRDDTAASCSRTLCSDSHAAPTQAGPKCACRCPPELPVFREDLHVCVDDVHECALATFKNGAKLQKIPFVFLPMKGQIIHPSSDIIFSEESVGETDNDVQPVCVVSSAQFLTRSGWIELRNTSDTEPPLRLFRDHRRTFLQWLGEQDLRLGMEGRVLIARLMCKDPSGIPTSSSSGIITHAFSTPCVAFRVAGSQGAREVMFTSDYSVAGSGGLLHGLLGGVSDNRPSSGGLTALEGVAVGLCVLLLGLVYAASVCVYLHVRRRKRRKKKKRGVHLEDSSDSERGGGHMGHTELDILSEGVVKNNPLLLGRDVQAYSTRGMLHSSSRSRTLRACSELPQVTGGGTSEEEEDDTCEASSSDRSGHSEDNINQHVGVTSTKALVHPERHKLGPAPPIPTNLISNTNSSLQNGSSGIYTLTLQPAAEGGSMERHPEESVSIVETLDEDSGFARARELAFLGDRHATVNSGMSISSEGSGRGSVSSGPAQGNPFLATPGTGTRRKLYFNPAYFEPEMLHAPPPAALEFLQKLREVITMSKHKMATKRFSPCLLGIPEEHDSICSSGEKSAKTQRSWAGSHTRRQPEPETASVHLPDDMTGGKQHTIRRWLEDLQSGDPVEEENIENNNPRESPKPPKIPAPPPLPAPTSTPPQKKLMDAVIKELVRERGLNPADSTSDETTQSEMRTTESGVDDNDYETITMHETSSSPQPTSSAPSSPISRPALMMYGLPELLAKTNGYNLVSEVYVNDGYSSNQSSVSRSSTKKQNQRQTRPTQGSAGSSSEPSSQSSSLSENLESGEDQESSNYPGRLTIQLADAPTYAERIACESEEFEPDTLDRGKKVHAVEKIKKQDICMDSLERPMKILLKSSGSFYHDAVMNEAHANKNSWLPPERIWGYPEVKEKKKRSPSSIADLRSTNISILPGLQRNKEFGSLREIFEAKRQQQLQKQIEEIETMWMPQLQEIAKRGATRSLVEPNEIRWRSGFTQQMVDEIRDLMWKSTPEAGTPLPRVSPTKPKRQRSADIGAQPPTPPPSVPPSNPPTLPPKQRNNKCNNHNQPPPSLPPKNLRGSRSPSNNNHINNRLPNLVTSHQVPPSGASAVSDEDDDQLQGGSCTLGRKVENCISDAFSTWGKRQRSSWEPEVKILHRPGDSGYLSSDSNNSLKRDESRKVESSETEESCDGESESGAESIGTDSFFFGRVRPQDPPLRPAIPLSRYTSDVTPGTTVVHMPPVPTVHIQACKKKPPPPPKRINSRLETKDTPSNNNNSLVRKLSSQYAL